MKLYHSSDLPVEARIQTILARILILAKDSISHPFMSRP